MGDVTHPRTQILQRLMVFAIRLTLEKLLTSLLNFDCLRAWAIQQSRFGDLMP